MDCASETTRPVNIRSLQRRAADLMVAGHDVQKVAKIMGVAPVRVIRWQESPAFRGRINLHKAAMRQELELRMVTMAMEAMKFSSYHMDCELGDRLQVLGHVSSLLRTLGKERLFEDRRLEQLVRKGQTQALGSDSWPYLSEKRPKPAKKRCKSTGDVLDMPGTAASEIALAEQNQCDVQLAVAEGDERTAPERATAFWGPPSSPYTPST